MEESEYFARRKALFARHPYMFAGDLVGYKKDPREDQLHYAIAIEPGWLDIIERLCADIDAAVPADLKRDDGRGFHIQQIKEKFGTLRFYWDVDVGPHEPIHVDLLFGSGEHASFRSRETHEVEPWRAQVRGLITEAERRSAMICFYCGGPGQLRKDRSGWITTCCDDHAAPGSTAVRISTSRDAI